MKLILKDSEWWRGNKDYSRMVVFDGTGLGAPVQGYCCLGVLAKQLGASPESLCYQEELEAGEKIPRSYPTSRHAVPEDYPEELIYDTNEDGHDLDVSIGNINDDPDMTDEERVERLRPLFRQAGVEIEYRPNE